MCPFNGSLKDFESLSDIPTAMQSQFFLFKKKMEDTCKNEEKALQLILTGYLGLTKELFLQNLSTCAKLAIVSQVGFHYYFSCRIKIF